MEFSYLMCLHHSKMIYKSNMNMRYHGETNLSSISNKIAINSWWCVRLAFVNLFYSELNYKILPMFVSTRVTCWTEGWLIGRQPSLVGSTLHTIVCLPPGPDYNFGPACHLKTTQKKGKRVQSYKMLLSLIFTLYLILYSQRMLHPT